MSLSLRRAPIGFSPSACHATIPGITSSVVGLQVAGLTPRGPPHERLLLL